MTDLHKAAPMALELKRGAAARPHDVEARSLMNAAASTIAALEAENVELRKDAERYRWLRAQKMVYFWNEDYKTPYATIVAGGAKAVDGHFLSLESAIDAALKEAP